ncbi:ABC transporter ATP-binding protein [Thermatribacter velox]|uniref:ABC transporter ATP-binding protein n=1 Tax=Thermatribacter velox TaxID=3039681 RepID=A0ABZ2YBN8_9BACT
MAFDHRKPDSTSSETRAVPGLGPGRHFAVVTSKPEDSLNALKRLWQYFQGYRWQLIVVFILVGFSSLLMLAGPYFIGKAIDEYIVPRDFRGLVRLLVFMGFVYLLSSLFYWLQGYLMVNVVQRGVARLRKDLFDTLQALPLRFFDTRPHGDLMSRLTNDVDNISNSLSNTITQMFSGIITILGAVVLMLWMSPELTAVSIAGIPLTLLVTRLVTRHTHRGFLAQQTILGNLNGIVEENISGLRVVKAFVREESEMERFEEANQALREAGVRAQIYAGVMGPFMNVINNLNLAIIAGVGGWFATREIVSIGTIASFIVYSRHFTRPLNELANQFNMLQSAVASAERIFRVIDESPEPPDAEEAVEFKEIRGEVEFRNVSFSYQRGVPVLKNVSFHVKPGQMVALVGPTGAGKTTIVNLLARFYEVDSGEILIDGVDIRKIKKESLRSLLGVVLQDTYLFSESVRENIRYGRLSATDEEVEEAARLANAEQFILGLPQGYDTILTDGGENLSQGQRQLLAIARVILKDPAILILDEATSNIDVLTEKHVQSAMLNLMRGRTSFVIAHRLSTIRSADLILVINQGEIVEQGTHQELLEKEGFYYRLYTSQFGLNSSISVPDS